MATECHPYDVLRIALIMSPRGHLNVLVFQTPEEVALNAAERFVVFAAQSVSERGWFSVVLAGGNTPRRLYELLATSVFRSRIEWARVHVFFGDERPVPPDHPDSNFRLANDALLSHVPIPVENVHRINGVGDPVENAQDYERELKKFFQGSESPRFDLVLLGMGNDGHTASLFPHTSALNEKDKWVVANWVDSLSSYRLTLTAPSINAAANVDFLVTGEDKASALARVLDGPCDARELPAQLIEPVTGELTWLVDIGAASKLSAVENSSGRTEA